MKVTGLSMDFEGDALNGDFYFRPNKNSPVKKAERCVDLIKGAKTLKEKCRKLVAYSDVSNSKIKNISKRRKKIIVDHYCKQLGYYDKRDGKLIDRRKKNLSFAKQLPFEITVTITDLSSIMDKHLK